jgi:hypothetical protein
MQDRIIPYSAIDDFTEIADSLVNSLRLDNNLDIRDEFPGTYGAHSISLVDTIDHLEKARDRYVIGEHEQFIVFSGRVAAGICVVTCDVNPPKGIRANTPNVSGFIAHPHRGRGLGRLSIQERMKVVESNFDNRAWTSIKNGNTASEHLIESVGFVRTDLAIPSQHSRSVYTFGDTSPLE